MDIEDLKQAWQSQSTRLDALEQENRRLRLKLSKKDIDSKRTKLLRNYRAFIIISFAVALSSIFILAPIGISMPVCIAYTVTMIILGCENIYMYRVISRLDLSQMTMIQALEHVIFIEKRRNLLRWVGIAVATIMIAFFFGDMYQHGMISGVNGGICGGILGGIIGVKKEREIRALIKGLQADLEDAINEQ